MRLNLVPSLVTFIILLALLCANAMPTPSLTISSLDHRPAAPLSVPPVVRSPLVLKRSKRRGRGGFGGGGNKGTRDRLDYGKKPSAATRDSLSHLVTIFFTLTFFYL
ncbi:hypothetical protein HDE_03870 [Halotydeus destructor]|nr:hypothetical protein HDE_03870 [Halotydeus destructor]